MEPRHKHLVNLAATPTTGCGQDIPPILACSGYIAAPMENLPNIQKIMFRIIQNIFCPFPLKGIEEGDFAMVMGYPGSTNRYKTSYGVNYTMQVTNPVRVQVREKKLELLADYMKTSQKARIQYASKYARSSNYYKYSIGQNKGLEALKVIAKKEAIENDFIEMGK